MKSTLSIIVLTSLLYIGCSKPAHRATTTSHFIAGTTSSGTSFRIENDTACTAQLRGTELEIHGQSTSGVFTIIFNHYSPVVGTYPIDITNQSLSEADVSGSRVAVHGSITLTTVVTDIVGTYSFTGHDSVIVNGSFSVTAP